MQFYNFNQDKESRTKKKDLTLLNITPIQGFYVEHFYIWGVCVENFHLTFIGSLEDLPIL